MRPRRAAVAAAALAVPLLALAAHAGPVTELTARHHDGQTFLTWRGPHTPGWTYTVYAAFEPILVEEDLDRANRVGSVGDSSWCDRRLSQLRNVTYGYVTEPSAAPLGPGQGLFVVTAAEDAMTYYAVVARRGGIESAPFMNPGENTLLEPVVERVARPRPVYQRTITVAMSAMEIYTLWTSPRDTPEFPAMSNRYGVAFDCGIVRGAAPPDNALMIRLHARDRSFLTVNGSGQPGEWRLTLDDYLPNAGRNTFWYGYHENYDITSNDNAPPEDGLVRDYTLCRMVFTVEWARDNFPIDKGRIYAMGTSMGGIGSVMLAFRRPDLLAGVYANVAKFDFSFLSDPDPNSLFNAGGALRAEVSRMWGEVRKNLPTTEGYRVYESLNDGFLAARMGSKSLPPIIAFNGKYDNVVGWAEKIGYYRAMNESRHGGYFFFDQRAHYGLIPAAWEPMQDPKYLYRFRLDRSFPALSNCSANGDPGDGTPVSGDSVGVINAFVEWDTAMVDGPQAWQTVLRLRNLNASWGVVPAPDRIFVDVTPRRLQSFSVTPEAAYEYSVRRLEDDATVQEGVMVADARGLLTLPRILVFRSGSALRVKPQQTPRWKPPTDRSSLTGSPSLSLGRHPVVGEAELSVVWPLAGEASVELFGVSGRLERTLFKGNVESGAAQLRLDPRGLPGGVYFLLARQAGASTSQRIVVLR